MKIVVIILAFVVSFFVGLPQVSGMLGVSVYSAKLAIDAIFAAASYWTILALLGGAGAAYGIAVYAAKSLVKAVGKHAAAVW